MKCANLLLMVLCCASIKGKTQSLESPATAWNPLSGAYSTDFSTAFSVYSNPASMAFINRFSVGAYGEKRFMLSEMGNYSAVIAIPTSSGNFAFTADYFGYKEYNETTLGISYGRKIGELVNIGARFKYHSVLIQSYGKASTVNAEIGSLFRLTSQLWSGFSVDNLFPGRLGKESGEKITPVYKAGVGYTLSPSCYFGVTVFKEENQDPGINIGVQYRPIKQLFAGAGIVTGNHSWYIGVGYLYKNLRLDITVSFHNRLGMSPGLLLLYDATQQEAE